MYANKQTGAPSLSYYAMIGFSFHNFKDFSFFVLIPTVKVQNILCFRVKAARTHKNHQDTSKKQNKNTKILVRNVPFQANLNELKQVFL